MLLLQLYSHPETQKLMTVTISPGRLELFGISSPSRLLTLTRLVVSISIFSHILPVTPLMSLFLSSRYNIYEGKHYELVFCEFRPSTDNLE